MQQYNKMYINLKISYKKIRFTGKRLFFEDRILRI